MTQGGGKNSSDAEAQTGIMNWYVHMMESKSDIGRKSWCRCVSNLSQKPEISWSCEEKGVCVFLCV